MSVEPFICPLPPAQPRTRYALDVTARIETPSGWVYLDDPINGYELHADTRKDFQVTHRKQTTNNSWTEGDFDITSVRGDITETVAVWITGSTQFEFDARLETLEAAFNQLAYRLMWR